MNTLRPAKPEDASAIAAVHVAAWQAAYPGIVPQPALDAMSVDDFTARWQTWLPPAPDQAVFVAEADGRLCGFASGGPLREAHPPFDAELYTLYVLPTRKRQGLGRQLFAAVAESLLDLRFHHLLLWCFRDNPSSGFYTRLGGRPVASSTVEIAGSSLATEAFGWQNLSGRPWS